MIIIQLDTRHIKQISEERASASLSEWNFRNIFIRLYIGSPYFHRCELALRRERERHWFFKTKRVLAVECNRTNVTAPLVARWPPAFNEIKNGSSALITLPRTKPSLAIFACGTCCTRVMTFGFIDCQELAVLRCKAETFGETSWIRIETYPHAFANASSARCSIIRWK